MKRHVNIPIFIPHLGCPNMCVFCNQRTISGVASFDISTVEKSIVDSLSTLSPTDDVEIAFFGGSFTGVDRSLMITLLKIAHKYILSGQVSSIRCSTRPDYIDGEILNILKKYSVKVIELGLQSSDEKVLSASKRGHDFESESRSCRMIVENGFSLVGQMMIGLPGSTPESEESTADFIIRSGASAARIYPTVVFRDTELCDMLQRGEYTPLTESEAVERSAAVFMKFLNAGVNVIRTGLCASENLTAEDTYYAGPNHPALGELVENRVYYGIIEKELKKFTDIKGKYVSVLVKKGDISKAVGQNKRNKYDLIKAFELKDIKFKEDNTVSAYTVRVCSEER